MGVESTETQSSGELASLQDTLGSEQIAYVETLDDEIETVIAESSRLQRFEYVIGTIDNGWVSSKDHRHFDLIHHNEATDTDDQIHCVIFSSQRSSITTDITEGRQVAVAGNVSFYPPENRCSIEVEEAVPIEEDGLLRLFSSLPVNRPQLILLAVITVLWLVLVNYLLL